MSVYNNNGNMCNERAAKVSRDITTRVGVLFHDLFKEGMSIIEARALTRYINAEMDVMTTALIVMEQFSKADAAGRCGGQDGGRV